MSDTTELPPLAPDTFVLDVRPLLIAGKEPFGEIMATLAKLKPGQGLAVRATFDPAPLRGVMGSKGFSAVSHRLSDEDWVMDFQPSANATPVAAPVAAPAPKAATVDGSEITIDVRGMEPPEPLLHVMAAVRTLVPGATLKVLHERRPALLYPKLDELGIQHRTEEVADDLFHIYITRPAVGA